MGLEAWRRLCLQFNPRTIRGTLNSQHLETHPRGAKKLSDLPGCLAEWERNLRRCTQEGRPQPDEETKRLALLKMLPAKQQESIWDTADKLYPTFAELLIKVQKLIQDDIDSRQGMGQMSVDNIEEEEWHDTGEVLPGKGANGEDALFVLQRRGNMTRIRPKGKGKGKGKAGWAGGAPEPNKTTHPEKGRQVG